jgi:hypothetical protein
MWINNPQFRYFSPFQAHLALEWIFRSGSSCIGQDYSAGRLVLRAIVSEPSGHDALVLEAEMTTVQQGEERAARYLVEHGYGDVRLRWE